MYAFHTILLEDTFHGSFVERSNFRRRFYGVSSYMDGFFFLMTPWKHPLNYLIKLTFHRYKSGQQFSYKLCFDNSCSKLKEEAYLQV
jgi:hypothetical protein